ncbi:Uncharacterised protein [Mycobacterium tuberculosis]|nr:Uncharacterised protein [Mycobacterium tuberculosis]
MVKEIIERKFRCAQLAFHLLGFIGVNGRLRLLNQGKHIAHPENPRSHPFRMERLKRIHLLAHCGELDRAARDCFNRQRGAASRVAVELRQNHAGKLQLFMEALRHLDGILSGHRIDDKQNFVWTHRFRDLLQLVHQAFVDMQTSGCIDDQIVVVVILRMLQRLLGDIHRTYFIAEREYRNFELLPKHLQLLDGCRTVNVRRREQRPVILLQQHLGQLAGGRRFPRALQTRHHNDRRRLARARQLALRAAHQGSELFVYNVDNDHTRCEALQHFLSDRPFLHLRDEFFDDLEVHVRFQKCKAYLAQRLVDIVLRKLAFSSKLAEHALQSAG